MTTEKKPYHKKRHPWKDHDLRSAANKALGPRYVMPRPTVVLPAPENVIAGIHTLLANHDGDRARPLLTKEQNVNIAAVRAWLSS